MFDRLSVVNEDVSSACPNLFVIYLRQGGGIQSAQDWSL